MNTVFGYDNAVSTVTLSYLDVKDRGRARMAILGLNPEKLLAGMDDVGRPRIARGYISQDLAILKTSSFPVRLEALIVHIAFKNWDIVQRILSMIVPQATFMQLERLLNLIVVELGSNQAANILFSHPEMGVIVLDQICTAVTQATLRGHRVIATAFLARQIEGLELEELQQRYTNTAKESNKLVAVVFAREMLKHPLSVYRRAMLLEFFIANWDYNSVYKLLSDDEFFDYLSLDTIQKLIIAAARFGDERVLVGIIKSQRIVQIPKKIMHSAISAAARNGDPAVVECFHLLPSRIRHYSEFMGAVVGCQLFKLGHKGLSIDV
jgi:hypothetical protein